MTLESGTEKSSCETTYPKLHGHPVKRHLREGLESYWSSSNHPIITIWFSVSNCFQSEHRAKNPNGFYTLHSAGE